MPHFIHTCLRRSDVFVSMQVHRVIFRSAGSPLHPKCWKNYFCTVKNIQCDIRALTPSAVWPELAFETLRYCIPTLLEELTALPRPSSWWGGAGCPFTKNPTPAFGLSGLGFGLSGLACLRPLIFRPTRAAGKLHLQNSYARLSTKFTYRVSVKVDHSILSY